MNKLHINRTALSHTLAVEREYDESVTMETQAVRERISTKNVNYQAFISVFVCSSQLLL